MNITKICDDLFASVNTYIERNFAPLLSRLKSLEDWKSGIPADLRGEKGDPGQNGEAGPRGEKGDAGERGADGIEGKAGATGIQGPTGEVGPVGPAGADGQNGAPGERGEKGERGFPGEAGRDGINGKDADPEVIASMVAEGIAKALPDAVQKAVDALMPGLVSKSAADAAALIPKAIDGKDGRDGKDGENGRDALRIEILPGIDRAKRYQRGTFATHKGGTICSFRATDPMIDGELEKNGWQVVMNGVDQFLAELGEDGREIGIAVKMTNGDVITKTAAIPVTIDRGVYKASNAYVKGDGTTWDGSFWIAQRAMQPGEKPDDKTITEDRPWRLAVKRGNHGRDGIKGATGERGAQGKDGRDLAGFSPGRL